jgi:hypothetical protein
VKNHGLQKKMKILHLPLSLKITICKKLNALFFLLSLAIIVCKNNDITPSIVINNCDVHNKDIPIQNHNESVCTMTRGCDLLERDC